MMFVLATFRQPHVWPDDPNKDKRDKKDKKDKKPTSKAKSGRKIGSWIVAHDEKGIPYW